MQNERERHCSFHSRPFVVHIDVCIQYGFDFGYNCDKQNIPEVQETFLKITKLSRSSQNCPEAHGIYLDLSEVQETSPKLSKPL